MEASKVVKDGIRRFWPGGLPSIPGGRAARQGFVYYAFRAWEIRARDFRFSSETTQDLARAESLVRALNDDPPHSETLEALTHQLLRAEAVASSRIEGLELSHKNLAEAAFDPKLASANAAAVLGNIHAMQEALRVGRGAPESAATRPFRLPARPSRGR